jgi:hypothetical protein
VLYRASDIPDSLVHKGWYVDRYDPKSGENRKTLLCRKITVEE